MENLWMEKMILKNLSDITFPWQTPDLYQPRRSLSCTKDTDNHIFPAETLYTESLKKLFAYVVVSKLENVELKSLFAERVKSCQ